MAKRRLKTESINNLTKVVENESPETNGVMDVVMANAYVESAEAQEHADKVNSELEDKALDSVKVEEPEVTVANEFTAKLVLEEDMKDFTLNNDSTASTKDGRARKVYEEDDEDNYLDYDMFDFIYGLVTDCGPIPLNPLGKKKLRKFMYIGSDKYAENPDRVENSDGHNQVATTGDSIEVYANDVKSFDDIKAICELYKFKYEGPRPKRSLSTYWNFSFKINVPVSVSGYPEMVEDYFESIGKTIDEVMPADWCKKYKKKQMKIEAEVAKRLAEIEVQKMVNKGIMIAARDSDPLETHLNQLFKELDSANLTYKKSAIKKQFMDAFADDYDDTDE